MKMKKKRYKVILLLFIASCLVGALKAVDNKSLDIINKESMIVSEVTNKTLDISFTPNNPYMKDSVSLYSAITQLDVSNIEQIDGVKSVTVVRDENDNPLSGYLKIGNEASYTYLKGVEESKNNIPKGIKLICGRYINPSDVDKNVIVLNSLLVKEFNDLELKELLNTGVEINGSVYRVVGIVEVQKSDDRNNFNEVQEFSFIPKSIEKELLARVNSASDVYNSISISIDEDADINSVETSVYNLLYDSHVGIEGYYEKDSVAYGTYKKLSPVLEVLNSFSKYLSTISLVIMVAYLLLLGKVFLSKDEKECISDDSLDIKNNHINVEDSSQLESVETKEEIIDKSSEKVSKETNLKSVFVRVIEFFKQKINLFICFLLIFMSYSLSAIIFKDFDVNCVLGVSVFLKVLICLLLAIIYKYLKNKNTICVDDGSSELR